MSDVFKKAKTVQICFNPEKSTCVKVKSLENSIKELFLRLYDKLINCLALAIQFREKSYEIGLNFESYVVNIK
jgi:hypothetical protein